MFANSDEYFDAHNTNLESLVEFNFINYSKLVALNFVSKHPPISFMKISDHSKAEVESPFKILFLGFGLLGESMFKAMFELGRFPNVASGGDFKAYAFDMRASHLKNKFLRRYPAFKNIEYARDYIEFIEGDIYSGDFEDKIVPLFKNVNCVIVSLGNDSLNRRVAYECDLICKRLGMPQKFFVAQLESLSEFYFESDDTIEFFGALQGILTEASVLKTDIEKLMSGINEVYGKINGYSKQKWENLNEMQRDTNLYLSLAIRTKLALLGLNFERFEKFNSLLLSPEVIDSLAHFEHLRWEAHYFVNGWDRLHFDSKSYIDRNMKFKPGMEKDSVRKLHMCLVTWRELDELNKCSPHYKDHKAFDIAVSRLLSELACKINKDPF